MSKIGELTNPVETGHAPSLQTNAKLHKKQTPSALLRITNEDFPLTEWKFEDKQKEQQ